MPVGRRQKRLAEALKRIENSVTSGGISPNANLPSYARGVNVKSRQGVPVCFGFVSDFSAAVFADGGFELGDFQRKDEVVRQGMLFLRLGDAAGERLF